VMGPSKSPAEASEILRDIPDRLIRCKDFIVGHFSKGACSSDMHVFHAWMKEKSERVDTCLTVYIFQNYVVGCFDAEEIKSNSRIVPGDACHYVFFPAASERQSITEIAHKNPASSVVQILGPEEFVTVRGASGAQSVYYTDLKDIRLVLSNLIFLNRTGLTIDNHAIIFYLRFFYVPPPHTIYNSVSSILPSEKVNFPLGRRAVGEKITQSDERRYDKSTLNDKRLVREIFERKLRGSCEDYKGVVSEDERVALLLSGGKDSSGLAIGFSASQPKVTTINISFDDQSVSEREDASTVANALDYRYASFRVTDEVEQKKWRDFCNAIGQPMADPAAFPLFLLIDSDLGNFDCFVDGTGNDKYFGLYPPRSSRLIWWARRLLNPLGFDWVAGYLSGKMVGKYGFSKLSNPPEEQYVSWDGFSHDVLKEAVEIRANWETLPLYKLYKECRSPSEHMTETVCGIWEPECAFRKLVQFAKVKRRKVFYPYLNEELESFVLQVPSDRRYMKNRNKVLLRELLDKHLPESIINKKKGSFVDY